MDNNMDSDVLIALIFAKQPIWDKRHKLHGNRPLIDKYWKEISLEMKQDEFKLRKRWRYLRDQFTVELGKLQSSHSGDEATTYCPKWSYFKPLLFLKGAVKPRANIARTSTRKRLDSVDPDVEIRDAQTPKDNGFCASPSPKTMEDSDASEPTTSAIYNITTASKRPKNSLNENKLKIKQKRLAYLQEKSLRNRNADNEHILFFKSLLSHIEKIPQHRLLSFRNRIQSVVEEFAYEGQYDQSTSTVYSHVSRHSTPEARSTRSTRNPIAVECDESESEQDDDSLAEFNIKYEQ